MSKYANDLAVIEFYSKPLLQVSNQITGVFAQEVERFEFLASPVKQVPR